MRTNKRERTYPILLAYEIDGNSHNYYRNKIVDKLKEYFLLNKGIKTIRIKNHTVQEIFEQNNKQGVEIFESFFS
ncbi:MAG TPA: hypothetical protein K8V28_02385 [Enterococcus gallinarum]|nr:hypothetical protein [Enterococcus gallinarum]